MLQLLDSLNPEQRLAVENTEGPVLVVAGAGSGKTKVITTRIMHLIHKGVSPYQILAMTFTNKAAAEMKHRVATGLGQNVNDLTITTFHSFCARFLRREIGYLDRDRNFAIFDAQDQTTCLKRVIRSMELPEKSYPAAQFRNRFSHYKNTGDLDAEPETEPERTIFRAYQTELRAQNALDFDDLLVMSVRILEEFEECRLRYQSRYRYLMIDEYQDTNKIQARLIDHLLGPERNLCVVGDEDQSIYGWRGADIRNILDFDKQYPGTRVFKLEQNYRSSQSILDYANQVISHNEMRKPKALWTAQGRGRPVSIRDEMSGSTEAEFIVQTVESFRRRDNLDYSNFAVLFRSNFLSRSIEEMCRRYKIPYQLIGGLKFYDRKEIKDLLSFMRIVVNPRDWTSFTRAIGVPSRGVGEKSIDTLYYLFNQGRTIGETLAEALATKAVSGKGFKGLQEFEALYRILADKADKTTPKAWLEWLIEELDYRTYLEKLDEDTVEDRIGNIDELLAGMDELERDGIATLSQFMDFSALVSDQDDYAEDVAKVSLMTIHAAKGLEFDTVFVMGLEDGMFPNQRSITENPNALEEERRLFYVAVTRAKQRLYLTYARRRQTYGSITSNPKSRFLVAPGASVEEERQDPFLRDFANYGYQRNNKAKTKLGALSEQIERMQSQIREQTQTEVDFETVLSGKTRAGDLAAQVKAAELTYEEEPEELARRQKVTRFKIGDVVRHPSFGTGTVTGSRGSGDQLTLVIYFPGIGKKTLVAKMAKLEKLYN